MLVKYSLPNKQAYPSLYDCLTLFIKSVSFFSASAYFFLFEVAFFFYFLNLASKFDFSTKSAISALFARFACFNLVVKFSAVITMNMISVFFFSVSLIFFP